MWGWGGTRMVLGDADNKYPSWPKKKWHWVTQEVGCHKLSAIPCKPFPQTALLFTASKCYPQEVSCGVCLTLVLLAPFWAPYLWLFFTDLLWAGRALCQHTRSWAATETSVPLRPLWLTDGYKSGDVQVSWRKPPLHHSHLQDLQAWSEATLHRALRDIQPLLASPTPEWLLLGAHDPHVSTDIYRASKKAETKH